MDEFLVQLGEMQSAFGLFEISLLFAEEQGTETITILSRSIINSMI
jgi:hypothetical protein